MNTSRLQLQSTITVDGKDVRLITGVSLNPAQHDILPHRQSQLSDLTIRLHITNSFKSISQKRWLYHLIFKYGVTTSSTQSINQSNNVTWPIVLCLHWSNRLQLIFGYDKSWVRKYSDISCWTSVKINNGWSLAVTVLQCKASMQQIGLPISASN